MRAYEFITEDIPVLDIDLGSDFDIAKNMRQSRDAAMQHALHPDDIGGRIQDTFGGRGGGQIRLGRAIQNTASSTAYPGKGAAGATTSPMAHDTSPVIPVNLKRVTNFEPMEKTLDHPQVNIMADKIRRGKGSDIPPIAVRSTPKGYEVIDGHHRLAAYQQAGAASIPVKVVEPQNVRRINVSGSDWGYDKSSKDFLKPGFDPNPKKVSYKQFQKELAKKNK